MENKLKTLQPGTAFNSFPLMGKLIVSYLISLLAVFPNTGLAQENEWELRTDKEKIKVYVRDRKNSSVKEFKATMKLNASLKKIEEIMDDYKSYHKWQLNVNKVTLLEQESDSVRYLYFITQLPWPLDNRDSIFRNLKVWSADSTALSYSNKNAPGHMPEKDQYVRIADASGFWKFKKNGDELDIIYQWSGDPGGNIPAWIVNLFIVEGPFETLSNLRELVE